MPRRRKKHVEQTTLDSMEVAVVLLDAEAENIEAAIPTLRAAEINCISVDEEVTSAEFLKGLAKWLRNTIYYIRR